MIGHRTNLEENEIHAHEARDATPTAREAGEYARHEKRNLRRWTWSSLTSPCLKLAAYLDKETCDPRVETRIILTMRISSLPVDFPGGVFFEVSTMLTYLFLLPQQSFLVPNQTTTFSA